MCDAHSWALVVAWAGWLVFERWLGQTSVTEANSTLDLVVLTVKVAAAWVRRFKQRE